ncbi:hypothetical protein ACJMK2_035086 [Sinanodonta woodiana]|uniref:HMG box domain-containing protein n=1 Tax=Sinanodonta woodiana TaxID=1069815 RepID=A0ABD3WTT4_SINWO
MLGTVSPPSSAVAGCKECEAAAVAASTCSSCVPVAFERDRDWLLIRTKMPVCIWPETCLLGCALEHRLNGGKLPHMPPFGIVPVVCNDSFSSPPPAHSGPAFTVDPKTGLPRPHIYHHPYAAPPGQFPPLLYNPDSQWQQRPGYPISSGASYHQLASPISRYPAGLFPPPGIPHPGLPHSALIPTGPKQEGISQSHTPDSHRHLHDDHIRESTTLAHHDQEAEKKRPHIKKPLNAFMLFMKEMRAKVVADCTLKESAAINQILGKKWHALDRSEQAKYYEMARKEKELHQQLYPGWSARDNYASHLKKKKRKKDQSEKGMLSCEAASMDFGAPGGECSNPKKCRARFGMEKQTQWCKPCRSQQDQSCDQSAEVEKNKSEEE